MMKSSKSSTSSSTSPPSTSEVLDIDALTEVCHNILVAEISDVARLPVTERLELAYRRRQNQLDRFAQFERQIQTSTTTTTTTPGARRSVSAGFGAQDDKATRVSEDRGGRSKSDRGGQRRRRKRPDSVSFVGSVTLLDAVCRRDIEEARLLLLASQCDINACVVNGITALHQACINGQLEMVKLLIAQPTTNVNVRDADHWTPLHTAALCGRADIASLLTNRGADVLALNTDGFMPYDLCEDETTLEVIESAMAKRDVTQEMINDLRCGPEKAMLNDLQRLARDQVDLDFRGQNGETPLHVAASNGYVEVAEYLLSRLVPIDAVDNDTWQPIHCAAQWRQVSMLETLVRHGADLNATTNDNKTPIDLCTDDTVRQWLVDLKTTQDARKTATTIPSMITAADSGNSMSEVLSSTGITRSTRVDGSHTSLYNSNLSLADKSIMSSSMRRLAGHDKESEKSKKDAGGEADLWTSMQSLHEVDDENEPNEKLNFADVLLTPPEQFITTSHAPTTTNPSQDHTSDISGSTLIRQTMVNALRSNALSDDQRTELILKNDLDSLQKQGRDAGTVADVHQPMDGVHVEARDDSINWEFKPKTASDNNNGLNVQSPLETRDGKTKGGKSKSDKKQKSVSGKKEKTDSKKDRSGKISNNGGSGRKSADLSISQTVQEESTSPMLVAEVKLADEGVRRSESAAVVSEPNRGATSAEMKKRRSEKRQQAAVTNQSGDKYTTQTSTGQTEGTTWQHYSTSNTGEIHRDIVKNKDRRCAIL